MIKSFKDEETAKVFRRQFSRKLPHDIQRSARRKLELLDGAETLQDLRIPPATLLSAKFERLDNLESRLQADLDNICETFNVVRHSVKFGKWRTTP